MDKGNLIHALIIEHSVNDAETMANSLRNAGYSVRYHHVTKDSELKELTSAQPWDLLIANDTVETVKAERAIAIIKESGKDIPVIVLGKSRGEYIVDMLKAGAVDVVNEDNKDHLLLVIGREFNNIRDRRAHRQERGLYHELEKRNRVLLDSSRDPIAYIHDGMHIYINQSYMEMFGYADAQELESIPIMDLIAPNAQQNFKDVLRSLSKDTPPEEALNFDAVRADSEIFPVTMEFSRASIDGEPCTQIIIHRANDNKELEKEIQQLRQQDLLTGLYNSQYFIEQLQLAVDRNSQGDSQYTLLYLEPDNYKAVRNKYGIAHSDMILTDIAAFLQEQVPQSAIIARYDATNFTILLNNVDLHDTEQLAEKIRHNLENKVFRIDENSVFLTCSIGVMNIPESAEDASRVLSQCESACNMARENNGNRIHTFSEKDELARLEADKALVVLVKYALKEDRFQLQYQPIVSLHAQPGERYEVLLRMLGQNNEVLMPGQFLDAANSAELMGDIDRWVIKSAAKAILNKRKTGANIQLFIKLSTASLRDPGLLVWISKLLQAARLHGDCLVFEISEHSAMNHLKETKALSDGLKQLHCHFAIDHAGEESDNFNYLKHLHVNYMKIDGNHITNINSEDSQNVIRKIVNAARAGNFQTIAEHVQDPGCLANLWQLGVNFIQGYYLQQPENNLNYDFTATEQ